MEERSLKINMEKNYMMTEKKNNKSGKYPSGCCVKWIDVNSILYTGSSTTMDTHSPEMYEEYKTSHAHLVQGDIKEKKLRVMH